MVVLRVDAVHPDDGAVRRAGGRDSAFIGDRLDGGTGGGEAATSVSLMMGRENEVILTRAAEEGRVSVGASGRARRRR